MLKEKLEKLEAAIDRIALSKRLEIEAEHFKRIKTMRILRLYTTPGKHELRVNTRIISPENPESKTELWDHVSRVVIRTNSALPVLKEEVDEDGNASVHEQISHEDFGVEGTMAEWTASSGAEAFLINLRPEDRTAQLMVKLKNTRQIYKLHASIARLFNKYSDTKPNVIKDFYRYINENRLNDYATSEVTCDAELERILNVQRFNFNDIAPLVDKLVEPVGYCVVDVALDEPQTWDINIECDDLGNMPVLYPKLVEDMGKKIALNRAAFEKCADKVRVLEEFIADPVFFINRKIALESDCAGVQTAFYDNLSVQTAVYELIKRHDN